MQLYDVILHIHTKVFFYIHKMALFFKASNLQDKRILYCMWKKIILIPNGMVMLLGNSDGFNVHLCIVMSQTCKLH